eukprot:TRINITY_DN27528_c0_g1_i1.p1 TRINITY_DN27528_c0_g1~~TRINITY_DN27528_c0_g1_i1.p1  ORF type:complete len:819 (+),score=294.54 TRINITY_DN27528_c0_g1_i1:62-2458(+)
MSLDAARPASEVEDVSSSSLSKLQGGEDSMMQERLQRLQNQDFSSIRMEQTQHLDTMHAMHTMHTTGSDGVAGPGDALRTGSKEWKAPRELCLARASDTGGFGFGFKGKRKMIFKSVDEAVCSDPDAAMAFVGRRLMRFNGRLGQDCTHIERHRGLECILEFAWPVGYPVRLEFEGQSHPCVIRDADESRYIVTGRDEFGIWDVTVPYTKAEELIEEGKPEESYVVSQELQLLTDNGHFVPVTVAARTKKGYKVTGKMGAERDGRPNEFTKLVKYYDAPRLLQPRLFAKVEFKDPQTQKHMKFIGMAAEKHKLLVSIDDVQQPNKVEDVKYKHQLEGDMIRVGAGGLGLGVHLPQGDAIVLSNLRLVCSIFDIKNNIPCATAVMKTSFEPHRSSDTQRQELIFEEKTGRQGIRNHENQAARHLCLVFRRIRINIHNNAPSIGIRCDKRPPLIVSEVIAGSPADDAGIRKGDMIISMETPNGLWKCYSREQLISVLGPRGFVYSGTMVRFDICRDQKVIQYWRDMFMDEQPTLPTRLPTNFHHAVSLEFSCRLPLPEDVVYCYVLADESHTHRDRIIHNLIPIADVYSQEMDYEYAAELIKDEDEFNAYIDDCSEATVEKFEDDPVTKAEAFHLHRYMMEGFGLPPLDQSEFERHFKDAAAFWNTYELPYEEVVSPLLRDFMVEVFSNLSAKAQKHAKVKTKHWKMRGGGGYESSDSSGNAECELPASSHLFRRASSSRKGSSYRVSRAGSSSFAKVETEYTAETSQTSISHTSLGDASIPPSASVDRAHPILKTRPSR